MERHTFKVARTNLLLEAACKLGSRGVIRALQADRRRLAKHTEQWKSKESLAFAVRESHRCKEDTLAQDRRRAMLLYREVALLKVREENVLQKEKKALRLRERVEAQADAT